MNQFSKKTYQISTVLIGAILGIAIGCILLWVPVSTLVWFAFIVLGVITLVSSIPGVVQAVSEIRGRYGILNLVLAIIPMVLGLSLIFWQNSILMILIGVYLLALPIYRVVISADWKNQLRMELPRLILGVILILIGPGAAFDLMFRIAGWVVLILSVIYALVGVISIFTEK